MQHSVRRSFSTQTSGNRTLQQREKNKFTQVSDLEYFDEK